MSAKRSNNEGSISFETGRQRWRVTWTEAGVRQPPKRFKTKTEASRFLKSVTRRVDDGLPGVDSSTQMKTLGEQWRRTAPISQKVSTRSMATYEGVLRLHINPVIGDMSIRDLRPSDIVLVMATMAEKGLSKSYQHQAHKVISGIVKMALADGLIARSPIADVPAPRGGHKAKVVPDRDQVQELLEAAPDARMRALIATLAYTGLRIGEALSLRWADWDGAGRLQIMTTKGGKPRAIPVPALLQVELKVWRKAQLEERLAAYWWATDQDWLLSTDVGTQWDPHNARKRWRPLADKVCPGATPHSLRHATATILLEEGIPMKVVSDLLGHTSTRTTEDTYSHVTTRLSEAAAAALDTAFGGLVPKGTDEAPGATDQDRQNLG